jgi:hypothetical protein
LPKQLGQGVVLQSAVAEGDILVMTVGGPSDWTQGWSQAEMSKMVAAGFCHVKTTEGYFEGGGKIRFDISEGGNPPVEGQVLDHCPEA